MYSPRSTFLTVVSLAGGLLVSGSVTAVGLPELLQPLLHDHEQVLSAQSGVDAAHERVGEALGSWYPQVEVTANTGMEAQNKPSSADTDLEFQEFSYSVTQKVWDFGATNATVAKSEYSAERAEVNLSAAKQGLVLDTLTAYANLVRARDTLAFARESEENIRQQTGLEEIRIEIGSGLSTDLLQAKTQLAGARARRVDAEATLEESINRFRALFRVHPPVLSKLSYVAIDTSGIPNDLDVAIAAAMQHNTDLMDANLAIAESDQDLRNSRSSEYYPSIDATYEQKWKDDVAGVQGEKEETLFKLELSYPFDLGFSGRHAVKAARSDWDAAVADERITRREVEEGVRNAWNRWHTAQRKSGFLQEQADIAKAFVDLAVEERKLGNRSLIDVLSGETSWINAKSDAESARTDIVLAAAELLRAMGRLDASVIRDIEK